MKFVVTGRAEGYTNGQLDAMMAEAGVSPGKRKQALGQK